MISEELFNALQKVAAIIDEAWDRGIDCTRTAERINEISEVIDPILVAEVHDG